MPTHHTTLVLSLALVGCSTAAPLPPRPAADPSAHEVHLVAFGADDVILLERIVGAQTVLRLQKIVPGEGPGEPLPMAAATATSLRQDWPGVAALPTLLAGEPLGADRAMAGYRVPEAIDRQELDTEQGRLRVRDATILLASDGRPNVELARLAPGQEPQEMLWWRDPGGRWAALTAVYEGEPAVVDLRIIRLSEAGARALATAGYEAHAAKRYPEAERLWSESLALDDDEASVHYNLACARALQARSQAALRSLERAIELGGDRYRALADTDDDLDSLREDPAFQALIARRRGD